MTDEYVKIEEPDHYMLVVLYIKSGGPKIDEKNKSKTDGKTNPKTDEKPSQNTDGIYY